MILDQTRRLEIVLGGAITTSNPECHVWYRDYNVEGLLSLPSVYNVAANGATDVALLAAPGGQNQRREVLRLAVYNKDTVNATVTIKTDVAAGGGTEYIILKQTLTTLQTLVYEIESGWQVL